jgi:transcriptional regulator with XRE-family HTH domain
VSGSVAPPKLPFGEALSARLSERQMSSAELARRCGIAKSTVSRLLSGQRPATPSLVGLIAAALVIERAALVAGTDAAALAVGPPVEELAHVHVQLEELQTLLGLERRAREGAEREAARLRATLRRIRALAAGTPE